MPYDEPDRTTGLHDILTLIYYRLTGNIRFTDIYQTRFRQIPLSRIDSWYNQVRVIIGNLLGEAALIKLKNSAKVDTRTADRLTGSSREEQKLLRFMAGIPDPDFNPEDCLSHIASSFLYGTWFLYLLNLEYAIIPELIPGEQKEDYEVISSLAAHKDYKAVKPGEYILINYEFQNYSYSLCREKADLYRFEIRTHTGNLQNKLIGLYLKHPDGSIDKIEEECKVITDTYILYYEGGLTGKTEIYPYISTSNPGV